jgi:predicted dehydrogenase
MDESGASLRGSRSAAFRLFDVGGALAKRLTRAFGNAESPERRVPDFKKPGNYQDVSGENSGQSFRWKNRRRPARLLKSHMKETPKISRRKFLGQNLCAAGAAIMAPAIIPASALGKGGMVAPSERITMGFIGVGGQGGGHLFGGKWTYVAGGYSGRKDVQVLAVCDVWKDRRDNATKRVNDQYAEVYGKGSWKSCEAYNDFRELLARPDIDAVLIATPAHWHAEMTIMAAAAGKDIYCEKPSTVTIQESQAMLAAVKRYGRVFQAGTQQRSEYGGKFRMAAEFVRSGRIGKLKEIYGYRDGGAIYWPPLFGEGKPIPEGLDWDMYLGPVPWYPYDGKSTAHRYDIGELNWAQHHYDIIQWTADADDTGPTELFVEGDRSCYKYANGVTVFGKPYPGEPVGADGGACFVGTDGWIAVDRDSLVSEPAELVREPLHAGEVHLPRNTGHANNFVDCIRTRQRPICNEDVAHHSVNAVLLGGIVKQLKRPLRWDPVAEIFPGDDEANRMMTIAKRPPWNT